MKTLWLSLGVLIASLSGQAQTVNATATWVQLNTLTDAQGWTYALKDGAVAVPLVSVTCAAVSGVTVCHAPAPLPSAGRHDFSIVPSSPSAARPVLLGVQPGAPNGFKVTISVVYATGQ